MFIKSHAMALSLRRLYLQTPRRLYLQTPAVTRVYVTACVLTTAAVLGLVTPVQLSFNLQMVIRKWQIWRLITHFFFFGSLGFGFLINIIFLFRYCRLLEEGCFRHQTADFVFLFLFGGVLMTALGVFTDQVFLGQSFPSMLVYLWSRRNPVVQIHFLGLLSFDARFLPWGLMGFSLLLGNPIMVDVLGIVVGQAYFCLMDLLPNQPGRKLLRTTQVL